MGGWTAFGRTATYVAKKGKISAKKRGKAVCFAHKIEQKQGKIAQKSNKKGKKL